MINMRTTISRTLATITAALGVSVIAAGCGSSAAPAPIEVGSPASTVAPSSAAAVALTAKTIVDRLAATGLPVTNVEAQDENSDPNKLLGRPNEYTSRASFDVPGGDKSGKPASVDRGGVVEIFPDAESAAARAKYIQGLLTGNPALGTEYDYQSGPVLIRISGKVVPSVARKFQAALPSVGHA